MHVTSIVGRNTCVELTIKCSAWAEGRDLAILLMYAAEGLEI